MIVSCHGRSQLLAALCLLTLLLYLALTPEVPPPHPPTVTKRVTDIAPDYHVGVPLQDSHTSAGHVEQYGAVVADSRVQVVHIAAVSCGSNVTGVLNLIKSAAIFTDKGSVHFHIFSDNFSEGVLHEQFSSISPLLRSRLLTIDLRRVSYPVKTDDELWKNTFKPCATARLFLHVLLPDITSVIYMDTDTLFFAPPKDLWAWFDNMNSSHLVAMVADAEERASGWYNRFALHPFFGELGVNSGVMLIHLERMRERRTNWTSTIEAIFHSYYRVLTWGDQDILNIYLHSNPDKLLLLPCEWNFRQGHCAYNGACKTAEITGVKVLHGSKGSFIHGTQLEFRAVYETFNRYTLKNVIEKRDTMKQRVITELSRDPRILCAQCFADVIRKTILSLID